MKVNDVFDRDIEYLYNSAKELGGTIREVACESGLFEAVDYVRIKIDPTISGHTLAKDDIELVEDDGSYNLWIENHYFLGNGANVGWLCHNCDGNELVKPDIYAVEQAMNTYYAECIIRRDEDPYFHIEEIDFDDEELFDNISKLIAQALPANWLMGFLHGEMPVSYKILAYQIAYIKYYYPKIYDTVWNECPPYLEMDVPFKEYDNVKMGITSVLGNMPKLSDIQLYHENVDIRKELRNFNLVDNPLVPIMKYYELDPKTKLGPGENALVLYIDEFQVMVGIVTEDDGNYSGTHTSFDKTIVEDFDKHLIDEMYEVVKSKIELLDIPVSEEDKAEFAQQVLRIKKQFRRNKKASVVFNNGWINYTEILSIQVMEKHFESLLNRCELLLQELITDNDDEDMKEYWLPDIKNLYLAGPMTDYKILWDMIKKENPFGGEKELILCGELENVVTRGLSLL